MTYKTALVPYMVLLAIGTFVSSHLLGFDCRNPGFLKPMFFFEAAAVLYVAIMARRIHGNMLSDFDRLDPGALVWFLPFIVAVLAMATAILPNVSTNDPLTSLAIVGTTILVGISEEGMFRGILLRGLLKETGCGKAIVTSSALFGVLHSLNLLAGVPIGQVGFQLVATFLLGLVFACLAVRSGALWPGMVLHALWDMGLILSVQFRVALLVWPLIGLIVIFLVGLILWFAVLRKPAVPGV